MGNDICNAVLCFIVILYFIFQRLKYFQGSVKKMLRWACEQTGARLQEVEVKFPITNKQQVSYN